MVSIIGDKGISRFDPNLANELNKKVEDQERQERLKQKILNEETKESLEEKLEPLTLGEKPKIKLIPLYNTGVSTTTRQEYNTLMQVFECGDWVWRSNNNSPTSLPHLWDVYTNQTYVVATKRFGYGTQATMNKPILISPQEFYNKQDITLEILKEIGDYFKNQEKK